MTLNRWSYEKLRESHPELSLPEWSRLRRTDRHRAKRMTTEQMIAKRTFVLMARTNGVDALQHLSESTRGRKLTRALEHMTLNPYAPKKQNRPIS